MYIYKYLCVHQYQECEALCTRIGIMVDGRLTCLGTRLVYVFRYLCTTQVTAYYIAYNHIYIY